MARVAGVNIPDNKRVVVALTYINGVGNTTAAKIVEEASVALDARVNDLTETELTKLRDIIEEKYEVEADLAQRRRMNINRLREINCYRGLRHKNGLPVRGQRTRTNARTKRGRRMAVGGAKTKSAPLK